MKRGGGGQSNKIVLHSKLILPFRNRVVTDIIAFDYKYWHFEGKNKILLVELSIIMSGGAPKIQISIAHYHCPGFVNWSGLWCLRLPPCNIEILEFLFFYHSKLTIQKETQSSKVHHPSQIKAK